MFAHIPVAKGSSLGHPDARIFFGLEDSSVAGFGSVRSACLRTNNKSPTTNQQLLLILTPSETPLVSNTSPSELTYQLGAHGFAAAMQL
jgi:hypothetical protein